jgi:hypothetical protein
MIECMLSIFKVGFTLTDKHKTSVNILKGSNWDGLSLQGNKGLEKAIAVKKKSFITLRPVGLAVATSSLLAFVFVGAALLLYLPGTLTQNYKHF